MRRILFTLALFILAACGGEATTGSTPASTAGAGTGPKLNVVTTVSPIVNIIHNIGGDRITLVGIVPEGVNSHTFEPAPSDAKLLAQADLIFVNGMFLEEPTINLAQANKKADAQIIELAPQTITEAEYVYDFSFPEAEGKPNPHLWMNPLYALRYAEIVRDTLVARDPANADYYKQNYEAFKGRIEALDVAIKQTIDSIPEQNRKLLTYHDSFAYFAPRYGMTIIGAIQPADFSEPSAREIADLITQLKVEQVPAIFGSEVFPSTVLDTIAEESDVQFVDTLRDDDLPGDQGSDEHSYVGLLVVDVQTMARVLGGNPDLMNGVDTTNVTGSDSAVQQPQE